MIWDDGEKGEEHLRNGNDGVEMSSSKTDAPDSPSGRGFARFKKAAKRILLGLAVVRSIRRASFPYEKEDGSVPLKNKLLYSAPSFSLLSLTMLITIHAIVFYETIGASLTFIAFFTALARSFDVITDPLLGWLSDSTRTRWGRRRPYIFFGCWGYAIAFLAFMTPPESLNGKQTAYWFGITYIIFYLFDTIANVPYVAWGPELTDDSTERESVYFYRGLFDKIGVLAGAAGPAVVGSFVASERNVFTVLALIFGGYYIFTMLVLVFSMQERKKSLEPPPVPLVPSILRAFKNIAFRPLLGAWILDHMALGMISAMIPFFVKYVLLDPDDTEGEDPDTVLAIALVSLFVAAGVSTPIWKWLSLRFGKRKVWLGYNVFNSITCFGFLAVGEGDLILFYILAFLNGLPIGGQFLTEAILSDIIDYDEFLNGTRSEGSFTVFATFIPKVVSIPASAIPLAVVSAVGFIPTEEDTEGEPLPQPQPDRVKNTIRVIFIVIPSVATLIAVFMKLRYPIKREEMNTQISEGILKHEAGQPAYDPILDLEGVTVLRLTEEEQRTAYMLDNFAWDTLLKFRDGVPRFLSFTIKVLIVIGFLFFAGFVLVIVFTFNLIEDDTFAWIPSFSCILAGQSLCFLCVQILRLKAAHFLETSPVDKDLVEKIIAHKMRGQRGGLAADKPAIKFMRSNTMVELDPVYDPSAELVEKAKEIQSKQDLSKI